ncbi:hypothetical protein INT44_008153 [Umbelopsis vinacea]|uniref:LRRK2 beta-propeller domain-containing protein n=1 Tax=Umbelopsis vinacea TaxID=44442 RepID=A0A8H7UFQ9_9FUNG|nr:hypothetical protein INT44_008153 [Umbelopsis vinacea]
MPDWTPLQQLKGHKRSVICLDYSSRSFIGGNLLASGSEDETCRIWDVRTGKAVKAFAKQGAAVSSVRFASKASISQFYMAVGSKVLVYDMRNSDMILSEASKEYEFSEDEINTIDINEKNSFLCTADDRGEVKVIDLESHKLYKQFRSKHKNLCMAACFRPKKPWELWSGGMDNTICQWDISRGSMVTSYDTNQTDPSAHQMVNPPFVYSLRISHDGTWVAAGLGDGSVQVLKLEPKSKKVSLKRLNDAHGTLVNSLAYVNPSTEPLLWSGSANGQLALWNLDSLETEAPIQQSKMAIAKLNCIEALNIDQSQILAAAGVTSNNEGALHLYDTSQ